MFGDLATCTFLESSCERTGGISPYGKPFYAIDGEEEPKVTFFYIPDHQAQHIGQVMTSAHCVIELVALWLQNILSGLLLRDCQWWPWDGGQPFCRHFEPKTVRTRANQGFTQSLRSLDQFGIAARQHWCSSRLPITQLWSWRRNSQMVWTCRPQ